MNKIILTRGCPASGKTTWANKFVQEHNQCAYVRRFNRDDIRRELFTTEKWPGYKYSKSNEKEVTRVQEKRITDFVTTPGYRYRSISIVDDTNLNAKTLKRFKSIAESWDVEFEVKDFFDVPLHKLFQRNLERLHSVPEAVIVRMFTKQLEIQGRIIKKTPFFEDCILVDLDGTVCERGNRSPYDWEKVLEDTPRKNVVEVVEKFAEEYKIIFLTGRDGRALEDSKKWAEKYISMAQEVEMYSRPAYNTECDTTIKENLIREHVLPHYNIKLAVDDRQRVCDTYRCLGIECWQVADGRF